MSYIDRSLPNGDKDELIEGEIDVTEPKVVKKNPEETIPLVAKTTQRKKSTVKDTQKIVIPKAFDADWYNLKIETSKSEQNYYNAKKYSLLKSYANIVYDFYTQIMYQFNFENNIIDMPEFIKHAGNTKCDINKLANILTSREDALLQFFNRDTKKMNSEFKSVYYQSLKEYAYKAWLLYYSIMKFGNLTSHLRFMEGYVNSVDLTNKWKIANCYRLHKKAEYRLENIKNFNNFDKKGTFVTERPTTCIMYKDMDSMSCYNDLLRDVDGYIVTERQDQMQSLKENVNEGVEKLIIRLYENYKDIKYVKSKLIKISNEIDNGNNFVFAYEDSFNGPQFEVSDLFERAKMYASLCEKILLKLDIKSRVFEDVNKIYEEMQEVIEMNAEKHYNLVELEFKGIEEKREYNEIIKRVVTD